MDGYRGIARQVKLFTRPILAGLIGLTLLAGCATPPDAPRTDVATTKTFEVPRRNLPLNAEQEKVRQQATRAVEADIDGFLARYIKNVTTEHGKDGSVPGEGTSDLKTALQRGALTISADDMRDLFPQYSKSAASRSTHSDSVHEAVTAMAQELYERALAIEDPRGRNKVLFTAGGVASGKTTAIRKIKPVQRAARAAQIVYDSTLRRFASAKRRIGQALKASKSVGVVYIFTPIEKSAKWLVRRAVKTGRVVPAFAAARSHWQSQLTFLRLLGKHGPSSSASFLLIDNSGDRPKLVPPESLHRHLYASSGRFADMRDFIRYASGLIRAELDRWKKAGKLIPETEAAFGLSK